MEFTEMPGIPMKGTNFTPPSKQQDHMGSTPASEKHMVAGRRKLDEFRKKRAGLKNKAAEKSVSNILHSEGLANGPSLGSIIEGNNGQDAQRVSVLEGDPRDSSYQDLQPEQASIGNSHETSNITKDSVQRVSSISGYTPTSAPIVASQLEGDSVVKILEENSHGRLLTSKIASENHSVLTGSGHGQFPWMKGTQEAENHSGLTGSGHGQFPWMKGTQEAENRATVEVVDYSTSGHASRDDYDSLMFNPSESTGVFLNGPTPNRNVVDSWKAPTEKLGRGFSQESLPMLRQETDLDASVLNMALSANLNGQQRSTGISTNGRRAWDLKETQSSFPQPNKFPFAERAEREPLFSSRLLEQSPFQPLSSNPTASPSMPSSTFHQKGPSLSMSGSDQSTADALSDKEKEWKNRNQQEEKQKHAENDDFNALEQHIDDLTQEKFALQRALESARSLADSLSQQNSALTEDFNSQGAIINQLQENLEKKQEEVTAQSLVVSSLMMERERAQQENNSAVERSQILAGEVIGLEEKVLRLRSSELKLQKELETLKADNDSFRVQLITLDKDRQNLRSMLEALQEDKKLLQSQLHKAYSGGDNLNLTTKAGLQRESCDASTSTDGLVVQIQNTPMSLSCENTRDDAREAPPSSMAVSVPDSTKIGVPSTFATLSGDDFRAIDSIDLLISELFSEKEALLELLGRESAKAIEFEALNGELSKKLEMQTQRLELAVAQKMAYEGTSVTANSSEIEPHYNDYVDEGDEVVERVLGWIMQIFPGGSSRRQSSKRL